MSIPTKSETYAKLMEYLRKAQEESAMLQHLYSAEGDGPGLALGKGWFHVSEHLKKMLYTVTELMKGTLQ